MKCEKQYKVYEDKTYDEALSTDVNDSKVKIDWKLKFSMYYCILIKMFKFIISSIS
jgi:hypothetical protein